VVSNLQPYVVTALNLDAPALPVGYSLGASRYWVLPSYKSGALIRYGERGAVSLRGILHGRDGQPMALVSGTVQRMDDGTESVFFTNRSGRFGLEALRAGRYQMRPSEHGSVPVEFAIPPGTVGGYSLGVLRSDWAQHQK
jgi:outer membrane usher protein